MTENVQIKAPVVMDDDSSKEAFLKLSIYYDKVFDKAFEETRKAYPDFQIMRNGFSA